MLVINNYVTKIFANDPWMSDYKFCNPLILYNIAVQWARMEPQAAAQNSGFSSQFQKYIYRLLPVYIGYYDLRASADDYYSS